MSRRPVKQKYRDYIYKRNNYSITNQSFDYRMYFVWAAWFSRHLLLTSSTLFSSPPPPHKIRNICVDKRLNAGIKNYEPHCEARYTHNLHTTYSGRRRRCGGECSPVATAAIPHRDIVCTLGDVFMRNTKQVVLRQQQEYTQQYEGANLVVALALPTGTRPQFFTKSHWHQRQHNAEWHLRSKTQKQQREIEESSVCSQAHSKPCQVFAFVRHESRARIEVTATRQVNRGGLRRRGGGGGATAANCNSSVANRYTDAF
jgi:hypothetical protein